jgi:hypothetical protein
MTKSKMNAGLIIISFVFSINIITTKICIGNENARCSNITYINTELVEDPCHLCSSGKKYMIYWFSDYREITIILVIHPNHIFLRSTSSNPNPDQLYWATDLTDEQFKIICNYLDSHKAGYLEYNNTSEKLVWGDYITMMFKNYLKDHAYLSATLSEDDKGRETSENEFWVKTYLNLSLLLWEINKQFQGITSPIEYPNYSFIYDRKLVIIKNSKWPLEKVFIEEK